MKNFFYSFVLLFIVNISSSAQSYNFESDAIGNLPLSITAANGIVVTDGDSMRSNTMTPLSAASGNTAVFDMDLFPSAANYSVSWKETYITAGRSGFTLRAFGSNSRSAGLKRGYLFQVNSAQNNLRIYTSKSSGYDLLSSNSLVAAGINIPRWYRATIEDNELVFEYSDDGINFVTVTAISDSTYAAAGATVYSRGYGRGIPGTFIDDVTFNPLSTSNNSSLTVASINEYKIFQRNSSNQADILVSGTYAGMPAAIEASFNGGPYSIIDSSPSGGSFSGTLSAQNAGQGALNVRFTNETLVVNSVSNIGVGDIFIIAGQSNASGRGSTINSYSHPTLKASLFGNDDMWKELQDKTDTGSGQVDIVSKDNPGGSAWPLLATSILANEGIPVAFVPTAKGGTGIAQWQPDSNHTDATTLYGSMNRRINAVGGAVAGVLFFQGERDAKIGTTQADYEEMLTTFVNAISLDFPGTKTMIGQLGASSFAGNDEIRGGQVATVNNNTNALLGPATYDIDLSDEEGDNLHFKSDGDMADLASRWYAAIDKEFYNGNDGYGPVLDVENLVYDEVNSKVIVPFLDDSNPVLDLSSTVTTSSFDLRVNNISVVIEGVSIVGNAVEITPDISLDTSQLITLTYASLNTAINNAIYDVNGLPAQPFYSVPVLLVPPVSQNYNFEFDAIGSSPSNITAANGTVATDGDPTRSNTMTPLSAASGKTVVFDMDLFPSATNYSVSWKETYTIPGRSGFTLRAFGSNSRSVGQKRGYLFQVNSISNNLRIYSTDSSSYSLLSSKRLAAPGINISRWYRATIEDDELTFEYSDDGINFVIIAAISDSTYSAAGTTQYTRGYGKSISGTFIDDVVFSLIFPDDNAKAEMLTVEVSEVEIPELELFPNPTTGIINIRGVSGSLEQINIYNFHGENVTQKIDVLKYDDSAITIDLSSLSSGWYHIQTKTTTNKVYKK